MNIDFTNILKGRVVVLGVGNPLKGDDGFGPALIERLDGKTEAVCIDAGSTPENYGGKIVKIKPDTIIIADAVHLGRRAGECEVLRKDDIARTGLSTHDLSLDMFIGYLEEGTGADIYMIGVQPLDVSFGSDMSESVRDALEETASAMIRSLKGKGEKNA